MRVDNQKVAVLAIVLAVFTIFGAFWLSRGDHDLKLMSLQAVLTTGGTLLGIAGTLLVGTKAYEAITSHTDASKTATTITASTEESTSKKEQV